METQRFTSAGTLFLALLLPLALTGGRPALPAPAAVPEQAASLPAPAQGLISALIGADQSVYHTCLAGSHFRMDNPGQGLSAEFSAEGMQVSTGEHSWGLALESYGYGESLQPLTAVDPTAHDNRIEYARGPLSEWYLNGPFGLEQGFTLASPPAVKIGGPLTLALNQSGDLQAEVGAGGRELVLSATTGEAVLRYSGLLAYDADGRELRAWLETRPVVNGRPLVLLRLDDQSVRYPLTIDPFVQKAKLTASDKAGDDHFGYSVAVSGDVVVVGASDADPGGKNNVGAAYVFVKPASGWGGNLTETAKLTASDKNLDDYFGRSVAISGGMVVVGAFNYDTGGTDAAGAAYVFVKPVGGWVGNLTETAKLTASDKAVADWFGFPVAVRGDVVAVGASFADSGGLHNAGAAYVFVKPAGGWGDMTQTAKLTASDKAADDHFGRSVAISGGVVVVGADYADPDGTSEAGAAYVFIKPGGGWGDMTQTAKLTASDKAAEDEFGQSVAISGNVVVIGAINADPGGTDGAGAAYVFIKPGSGWGDMTQTAKLTASDKAVSDSFGMSVAISGDVVVVGAYLHDPGGIDSAGAAYVFLKPASGWIDMTQTAKLTALDKTANDWFGYSVSVSGGVVVVGAHGADPGVLSNAGAGYMFDGGSLTNFRSLGANDGDILESGESSSTGGTIDSAATTFRIGDDSLDKQYRSVLSFFTASLPNNAVITSVVLKIKKQGVIGTNPFTTHQGLIVDIRKPYFGTTVGLAAHDFQAVAGKSAVGTFGSTPVSGWYSVKLNTTAYAYMNKTGTTQFRLRFTLGDNDDLGDDYVMFYSGNWSTVADRPLLVVRYVVP